MVVIIGTSGNDTRTGGAFDDILVGLGGSDTLSGGLGHDQLFGGAGNDQLLGGAGNDQLHAGDGFDFLFGGDGDDTLFNGKGQNTMFGDAGADTFVLRKKAVGGASNQDQIADFEPGVDRIDISDWGVTSLDQLSISLSGPVGAQVTAITFEDQVLVLGRPPLYFDTPLTTADFVFAPETTVIDFETFDSPLFFGAVNNFDANYEGMTWSSAFAFLEVSETPFANGAENTTAGGDNVAFNAAGQPISMAIATDDHFDLISFDTGAMFDQNGIVQVAGFNDGQVVALAHVAVRNDGATAVDVADLDMIFGSFVQLDELKFSYDGRESEPGDIAPPAPGVNSNTFYLDDLEVLIY